MQWIIFLHHFLPTSNENDDSSYPVSLPQRIAVSGLPLPVLTETHPLYTEKNPEHFLSLTNGFDLPNLYKEEISLSVFSIQINSLSLKEVRRFYHVLDRKSTRLNSSHVSISYAVF